MHKKLKANISNDPAHVSTANWTLTSQHTWTVKFVCLEHTMFFSWRSPSSCYYKSRAVGGCRVLQGISFKSRLFTTEFTWPKPRSRHCIESSVVVSLTQNCECNYFKSNDTQMSLLPLPLFSKSQLIFFTCIYERIASKLECAYSKNSSSLKAMICPRRDVANFKVPQTGAATAVLLIKQWRQCSKPQASNWIKQNEVWLYLTTILEYITVKSACIYWQTPSFEPNRMLSVKTATAVSYGATQSTGHDCRLRHITHVINRDLNA